MRLCFGGNKEPAAEKLFIFYWIEKSNSIMILDWFFFEKRMWRRFCAHLYRTFRKITKTHDLCVIAFRTEAPAAEIMRSPFVDKLIANMCIAEDFSSPADFCRSLYIALEEEKHDLNWKHMLCVHVGFVRHPQRISALSLSRCFKKPRFPNVNWPSKIFSSYRFGSFVYVLLYIGLRWLPRSLML